MMGEREQEKDFPVKEEETYLSHNKEKRGDSDIFWGKGEKKRFLSHTTRDSQRPPAKKDVNKVKPKQRCKPLTTIGGLSGLLLSKEGKANFRRKGTPKRFHEQLARIHQSAGGRGAEGFQLTFAKGKMESGCRPHEKKKKKKTKQR